MPFAKFVHAAMPPSSASCPTDTLEPDCECLLAAAPGMADIFDIGSQFTEKVRDAILWSLASLVALRVGRGVPSTSLPRPVVARAWEALSVPGEAPHGVRAAARLARPAGQLH